MNYKEQIAADLLNIKAVTLSPSAPYTWASGIQSPIYTDNRKTLAYPEVRNYIKAGFVEAIKREFSEVEVVAGTATAGIPHGAVVADAMGLPFAYIRSKAKDHGAGNQVEGYVKKGQKMVIVEDLISTGGSVLEAARAAEREGAIVLGIVAIFTYELPRSTENFAKENRKLVTLTDYTELIGIARKTGYVTDAELALLKRFKENQTDWQK